jgi:site-specific DNA recombinase
MTMPGGSAGARPFGFERDGVTINPAEAAEIVDAADALLPGCADPADRR